MFSFFLILSSLLGSSFFSTLYFPRSVQVKAPISFLNSNHLKRAAPTAAATSLLANNPRICCSHELSFSLDSRGSPSLSISYFYIALTSFSSNNRFTSSNSLLLRAFSIFLSTAAWALQFTINKEWGRILRLIHWSMSWNILNDRSVPLEVSMSCLKVLNSLSILPTPGILLPGQHSSNLPRTF